MRAFSKKEEDTRKSHVIHPRRYILRIPRMERDTPGRGGCGWPGGQPVPAGAGEFGGLCQDVGLGLSPEKDAEGPNVFCCTERLLLLQES